MASNHLSTFSFSSSDPMIRNILLKFILAINIGILLIPTIQMKFGLFHYEALDEARVKKDLPTLSAYRIQNDLKGIVSEFEAWFNDNYGLRDFLIRLGTQINYSVFQYSDKIHIGHGGFLYYRFINDDHLFGNYLCFNRQNMAHAVYNRLMGISDKLKQKGIRMVFIICPVKPAIYPEYLPKSAPYRDDLCFRELNELLKNQTDIIYFDVQERLFALKDKMAVFHKTDFHWTDPAAFLIAEEIVNTMGRVSQTGEKIWKHTLEIRQSVFSGGEARFMPLFIYPEEDSIFVKKNWPEIGNFEYTNQDRDEYIYHSQEKEGVLPTTVFLGNSFGDGFTESGMYTYFKHYYRASSWHVSLDRALDELPEGTQFFILQTIETVIPCLAREDCITLSW
jgi:hypothetical protein